MLLGCEFVFENAEAVDLYLDAVTRLNGSNSRGSSCGNEIAGFKSHGLRDVTEEFGDGEDQVAGGTLLLDGAVEPGDDGDGRAAYGVDFVGDDGADRAEGVEAFAAGPLAVGLLDVASGDVVDADVAANVGADVFVGADLMATAGDNDAEFALEVDAGGDAGNADDAFG